MLINKYIFQLMALLALIMMNPQEPNSQIRLGENEDGDLFAHAMASKEFNNDGIMDLAVGTSYKGSNTEGTVYTFKGSNIGQTVLEEI